MQQDLFENQNVENVEQHNTLFDAENYRQIVLTSNVKQDEYTKYIADNFDLHISDTCTVAIPNKLDIDHLNYDWNIGVICGASGSGKSTILRHICKQMTGNDVIPSPVFDNGKTLIANFDNMSPKDATLLLSQMGLASVPTWIRPYNVLSNGEQYRAQLAKLVTVTLLWLCRTPCRNISAVRISASYWLRVTMMCLIGCAPIGFTT